MDKINPKKLPGEEVPNGDFRVSPIFLGLFQGIMANPEYFMESKTIFFAAQRTHMDDDWLWDCHFSRGN